MCKQFICVFSVFAFEILNEFSIWFNFHVRCVSLCTHTKRTGPLFKVHIINATFIAFYKINTNFAIRLYLFNANVHMQTTEIFRRFFLCY